MRQLALAYPEERQRAHRDLPAFLRETGAHWLVLQVYAGQFPILKDVRVAARLIGPPCAVFTPYGEERDVTVPLAYQDDELPITLPWAWEAAHAPNVGPVVEIYRLR